MQQSPTHQARFEPMERRTLFSVVSVDSFGAKMNDGGNDFSAVQAAINAARPGDTVSFGAGTYNINGQLLIRTGLEVTGAKGATLQFESDSTKFAAIIQQDASNVWIHGLNLRSNSGMFAANGYQHNLKITDNDVIWGNNASGYVGIALRNVGGSDGLVIEHNYFHDSQQSQRVIDINDPSHASYSYNRFYKIQDGGHVMDVHDGFKFQGNVGEQIHRFGLELQDEGGNVGNNILIDSNVFTKFYHPYPDSFGMSIMPQRAQNVRITNNYLSTKDMVDGWGPGENGDGLHRFGLGVEAGFSSGEISGNTFVGTWAAHVTCSMPNMTVKNNKFYGHPVWTYVMGEPGLNGNGSASMSNNQFDGDDSHAPAAPNPSTITPSDPPSTPNPSPTGNTGTPTGQIPLPSGQTWLSDMTWQSANSGWGATERNMSNGERSSGDGHKITINGATYDKGIGTHSDSAITYNVGKHYSTFFADIGVDDEVNSSGSVIFEVWGDGVKLFGSNVLRGTDAAKSIQIDIHNVTQLKLVTTTAGDGDSYDHADWAGARLKAV